jgi:hypothetical protein
MVDFNSFKLHTQVTHNQFNDTFLGYHRGGFDQNPIPLTWLESPGDGCECTLCLSRLRRVGKVSPIKKYFYKVGSETEESKQDHFFTLCDYIVSGYALEQRQWRKYSNMQS